MPRFTQGLQNAESAPLLDQDKGVLRQRLDVLFDPLKGRVL
jgi:hypothetical protein